MDKRFSSLRAFGAPLGAGIWTCAALLAGAICAIYAIYAICTPASAAPSAGTLVVSVLDRSSEPVADAAVYAVPEGPHPARSSPPPSAVMDQRDKQFVPHVLVVQAGTRVDFPNNDSVSHHVYSFSPTHPFELPLYKGDPHPPLIFDEPGTVVLGCNIHDSMLGYILVVDTPYFGKTGADGRVDLGALPPGKYDVHVWTDRAKENALPKPITIEVPSPGSHAVTFRFSQRLFPPYGEGDSSLRWTAY